MPLKYQGQQKRKDRKMSTDIIYFLAGMLTIPATIIGWEYYAKYKKDKKQEEKKKG